MIQRDSNDTYKQANKQTITQTLLAGKKTVFCQIWKLKLILELFHLPQQQHYMVFCAY